MQYEHTAGLAKYNLTKSKCHYNAGCSWSLANQKSRAFTNLFKAVELSTANNIRLPNDPDLVNLHNDLLWKKLLYKIELNLEKGKVSYLWGAYCGILLMLIFYNFFLFLSLKETTYLYYVLFIFTWFNLEIGRSVEFGKYLQDLFFYLKILNPASGQAIFLPCVVTFFYLLFVASFLPIKNTRYYSVFKYLMILYAILALSSYILAFFSSVIIFPLLILSYTFSFVIAVMCWKNGYRAARFFVVGNLFFLVGIIWTILANFEILGFPLFMSVFYPDNIGGVIFMTLLSLALGDKLNLLKKEKAEAQEKALELLEQKVKERTVEVEKAKSEIEEKNNDIIGSIRYAKRIQQALLPSQKFIEKTISSLKKDRKT